MDLRVCTAAIAISVILAASSKASAQNATIETLFLGLESSPGNAGWVTEIAESPLTGEIYVIGFFNRVNGTPFGNPLTMNVAKLNSSNVFMATTSPSLAGPTQVAYSGYWQGALSSIVYWPRISAMVIGGSFSHMSTNQAENLARLTIGTTQWQPLSIGGVGPGHVNGLSVDSSNDLVIVGQFSVPHNCIVRTDGSNWWPLGLGPSSLQSLTSQEIDCVHAVATDDVVVAGHGYTTVGGVQVTSHFVEAWDGTTWTLLATVGAQKIMKTRSGDVYITGYNYLSITGQLCDVAKWDGSNWSAVVGVSAMYSMDELLNGDVILATSSVPLSKGLARLDTHAIPPTLDAFSPLTLATGPSFAVKATGANKETVYAGVFGGLTKLTPMFGAGNTSFGSTCNSGLLLQQMNAQQQPWLGGTFDTICTKLATAQLLPCIPVLLISTGVPLTPDPLSNYTPAPPNCTVDVDLHYATVIPLSNPSLGGIYHIPLQIPAAMGLVGANLYQQALAYDASGLSYTSIAWKLTLGGFGPW